MKNKLLKSITAAILSLSLFIPTAHADYMKIFDVIGDYYVEPPRELVDTITVEFASANSALKNRQPLDMRVLFKNIPEGGVNASAQWFQDGSPLSDGYFGDLWLENDFALQFTTLLPYYGASPATTAISLEIVIDGAPRRETINIPYENGSYLNEEAQRVLSVIQPIRIPAVINKGTTTYSNKYLSSKVGYLDSGTSVYYFDHLEEDSAYVQTHDGSFVWVPYNNVTVSTKNLTISSDYAKEDKETFINAMGYYSKTSYLIWINPLTQKVNIFTGERYNWSLLKTFTCATGANQTPTPLGVYEYCARDTAWIKPDYQVRPILYFEIYRGLAFHSRLYSPDGSVLIDSTIGRPVSHGCIRMLDDDVRWMEKNMTFGSTVLVY